MTQIPDDVLHAFANAYKFSGSTRISGNGKLEIKIPSYGQAWVTIDLYRGLDAALRQARALSVNEQNGGAA